MARDVLHLEHLLPLLLFLPLPYQRVGGVGVDDAEVVAPVIAVIVVAKINSSIMKKNKNKKKHTCGSRAPAAAAAAATVFAIAVSTHWWHWC